VYNRCWCIYTSVHRRVYTLIIENFAVYITGSHVDVSKFTIVGPAALCEKPHIIIVITIVTAFIAYTLLLLLLYNMIEIFY